MKMKILKDQSVQTTANVESVAHIYNKYNYILIYIQTALYKYIYIHGTYMKLVKITSVKIRII